MLAILVVFQVYILREPGRIQAVLAEDKARAVAHGEKLFTANCVACHGRNGEGVPDVGPALNIQEFLKAAPDETIFDIISDGRPNTAMPAWNQAHGGPLTSEDIHDLVTFIRNWQSTAPSAAAIVTQGNSARGAVLYSSICFACHGLDGQGTNIAPALNDKDRLAKFDDDWYRKTIAEGRPSRGMPTWGKVLSPGQINDLVAYIRSWESGALAAKAPPLGGDPIKGSAVFAATCVVCHGENGAGTAKAPPLNTPDFLKSTDDTTLYNIISQGRLAKGMPQWGRVLSAAEISDLIAYIRSWQQSPAQPPPSASAVPPSPTPTPAPVGNIAHGEIVYATHCAVCHGVKGEGVVGPNLHGSKFIRTQSDGVLHEWIAVGQPARGMPGFALRLSTGDIVDLIALLRSWQ